MSKVLLLVGICVLLLLGGCGVSSQYILTSEYTNPNTGGTERIDIPVSQYTYEQTDVGDNYGVTIKTLVLGVRIPITDRTSSSRIALIETIPSVMIMVILVPLGWVAYQTYKKRTKWWSLIVMAVGALGGLWLCLSGIAPEFTTTGIIIDKTFQIISSGL